MEKPWLGESTLTDKIRDADGNEADGDAADSLVGCRVRIEGSDDASINGKEGVVRSWDQKRGRYRVELDDGHFVWVEGRWLMRTISAAGGGGASGGGEPDQAESMGPGDKDEDDSDGGNTDAAEIEEQQGVELVDRLLEVVNEGDGDAGAAADIGDEPAGSGISDRRRSKHCAQCTFDGKRMYKKTVVSARKQDKKGRQISTMRLQRVQDAAKQIAVNRAPATCAADKATVLQLGSDYAFAMEDDDGCGFFYVGRLQQMKRKNRSSMNTPILLDDAKREGVSLVCSWFKEDRLGALLYDADSDLSVYSSWCCLGQVDLVFVPGVLPEKDVYVYNDPDAIENLYAAVELTHRAEPAQPIAGGSPEEAAQRRQVSEQARSAAALDAESRDTRVVQRAPGKRQARIGVQGRL
jgi:hypothetical protein